MKINPEDDGEYTDTESAANAPTQRDDKTQAEGEYTDSETENPSDAE